MPATIETPFGLSCRSPAATCSRLHIAAARQVREAARRALREPIAANNRSRARKPTFPGKVGQARARWPILQLQFNRRMRQMPRDLFERLLAKVGEQS